MSRPDAVTVWSEPLWVDTTSISTSVPYTVVDLCCGCGGFTLGFQGAGYLPLLGIEMDPWAAATFRRSLPDVPLLESPVERLSDSEILDATGGRVVDVLCAGLPCQGFSTNNGRKRADDGRNWLFTQLARLVELLRPQVVVVENVPSIASECDGAFARWLHAALADSGLGSIGLQVLNAADYGVPQRRRRAIIVATTSGPGPYPAPLLAECFHRSVDSAIGDLRGLAQGAVPNHEWPSPGDRKRARIAGLSWGQPLYPDFTGCCRRLWPDRPAYTVTSNNGQPHIHPHEDRFISVREMARLQGFPDSFVFGGSVSEAQRQVGNAIPPPLAEHVALALRSVLRSVHGYGRTADRASAPRAPAERSIDWWTGKFHRGDCVELMGQMPERSVDLIVTSPPYNIRNSTGNGMKGRAGGKWANAALKDGYSDHGDDMPYDEYVAWQRSCLESMMRVLADDGAIFYNHKWRVQGGLLQDRHEIVDGFPVRQAIVWRRSGGINFNPGYFLPTYEVIYLICKPKFKLVAKANAMTDVWEFPQETDNEHPAPFPVELADRCIRSTAAQVVLDPFVGSGTTAIAAERLGRRWIGIDISAEYCRMAEERLAGERECDRGRDVGGGVLPSSTWCDVASLPIRAYNPPTPMPGIHSGIM